MKYLVMECHLSYAVVLDEEGCFRKVANRHYEVGQTVTDVLEMQIPQDSAQKKKTNRWMYSLAAAAACLVLAVTSVFHPGQATYASVYMTINPEVRIDVNRNDVVVGLEGINADGDELIEDYRYKKKDLDLVMDELVDRAIDMGYLHEGGQISLVLDTDSDEWVISHSDTLPAHLKEHLQEKLPVTIEVSGREDTDNGPNSVQTGQVIIPVLPEDHDYGESDYGEADPTPKPPVSTKPENSSGESNYDDGQTDYGDQGGLTDDGQTDYDAPQEGENDDDSRDDTEDKGPSEYAPPDDPEGDQSGYDDEPDMEQETSNDPDEETDDDSDTDEDPADGDDPADTEPDEDD